MSIGISGLTTGVLMHCLGGWSTNYLLVLGEKNLWTAEMLLLDVEAEHISLKEVSFNCRIGLLDLGTRTGVG